MEKLRYSVMAKDGKIKSYIDKSWCYCASYPTAHKHPETEARAEGKE